MVKKILLILIISLSFQCEKPEKMDRSLTPEQAFMNYGRMKNFGMGVYDYVPKGYNYLDGSLLAGATDDAEYTNPGSSIQSFNNGSWNQFSNPDDQWADLYKGIRSANIFLEKSENYREVFAVKDTFTTTGKDNYLDQINDIEWLRNEVRILRALYYFELAKRYGGVPLVNDVIDEDTIIVKSDFDDVIKFIKDECDLTKGRLRDSWEGFRDAEVGRVDFGTALALKSRALLYAASPLFNPEEDNSKWVEAAQAAFDIINLDKYRLASSYRNLFLAPDSYRNSEVIFSRRLGLQNFMEIDNYPIGTNGGHSGTTPSENLVESYERLGGWEPKFPYENRDPRLNMTVVVNNSEWNNRKIESWSGGRDGGGIENSSKTGYYLKKFLTDNLDINHEKSINYSWILFRYGEVLLNFAEAMNEAYGPDSDPLGYGLTARESINLIRNRQGVEMPPVTAQSRDDFREIVKQERRIELAFEGHRFFDIRRWKDGMEIFNLPLKGVSITKNEDGSFEYREVEVENRFYDPKMDLYPIPQSEIDRSKGLIEQNPNW